MRPRRVTACLLLVLAAVAAGCGNGDAEAENAYVDAVGAAQRTYVTRFEEVGKRLTATSTLEADRATLGAFAEATGRFVVSLKNIDAPEAVERQHAALTAELVRYRGSVDGARDRLGDGSAADRQAVRTELTARVLKTQEAIAKAVADINTALRG